MSTCERCGKPSSAVFVCRKTPCPREDKFFANLTVQAAGGDSGDRLGGPVENRAARGSLPLDPRKATAQGADRGGKVSSRSHLFEVAALLAEKDNACTGCEHPLSDHEQRGAERWCRECDCIWEVVG